MKSEDRATYDQYVGENDRKTSMGDLLGDRLKNFFGSSKDPRDEGNSGDAE